MLTLYEQGPGVVYQALKFSLKEMRQIRNMKIKKDAATEREEGLTE